MKLARAWSKAHHHGGSHLHKQISCLQGPARGNLEKVTEQSTDGQHQHWSCRCLGEAANWGWLLLALDLGLLSKKYEDHWGHMLLDLGFIKVSSMSHNRLFLSKSHYKQLECASDSVLVSRMNLKTCPTYSSGSNFQSCYLAQTKCLPLCYSKCVFSFKDCWEDGWHKKECLEWEWDINPDWRNLSILFKLVEPQLLYL